MIGDGNYCTNYDIYGDDIEKSVQLYQMGQENDNCDIKYFSV